MTGGLFEHLIMADFLKTFAPLTVKRDSTPLQSNGYALFAISAGCDICYFHSKLSTTVLSIFSVFFLLTVRNI